ncbi:MAG: cytoplasmic protein [Prevotella sp.]
MENRILEKAHKSSIRNWDELKAKEQKCGCFSCCKVFNTSELEHSTKECDGKRTAICPYCGTDSVIGEYTGFPITEDFMKKMEQRWFGF